MILDLLPTRTAGAAENMAVDFLLLQRYPHAAGPRFRHYDWRAPAFTFGYSQKIAFVREQLSRLAAADEANGERFDLCRRPTGGGLVDHRNDWTYALVIPRGHPLEELRATQSYRLIHETLASALREQGAAAVTKPCPADGAGADEADERCQAGTRPAVQEPGPEGVCFQRVEIYDVVQPGTGVKIAGAAQKRNKHGLLFQGSIWRPAAESPGSRAVDWERFENDFVAGLAAALGAAAESVPWPEFNDEEVSGLIEQYSSPEWIEHR